MCENAVKHNQVHLELKLATQVKITSAPEYAKTTLYLQLFIDPGGKNQSRAVAEFDRLGEVVSLEVLGVAWCPRNTHNLFPHQTVYNRRLANIWKACRKKDDV